MLDINSMNQLLPMSPVPDFGRHAQHDLHMSVIEAAAR